MGATGSGAILADWYLQTTYERWHTQVLCTDQWSTSADEQEQDRGSNLLQHVGPCAIWCASAAAGTYSFDVT